MHVKAQRLGFFGQSQSGHATGAGQGGAGTGQIQTRELVAKVPHPPQKAVAAFHARVVPLQRSLGRRSEHGVQARGVGAVFLDQVLRIDAVVLGLGHGAHALVVNRRAHGQSAHRFDQARACDLAGVVKHVLHVLRPEILLGALVGAAGVNVVEHHALREQLGKGLVNADQANVTHHLGPKAGVEQMQYRVLNTANVLVHAAAAGLATGVTHPISRARAHHLLSVGRVAVAHVIPTRIDKGVHGVGLAPRSSPANRAGDASMKTFVLVQRVARAVGNAVQRQHHGQVFFRHRHRTMLGAVDDRNRRAPVALAAHAPVTQAPGGFLLTQAQRGQVGGDRVYAGLESQAVVFARVHCHTCAFFGVPGLPCACVKHQRSGIGRCAG